MSPRPLPRSYWSKVDSTAIDPSQCWPWKGALSAGGRYGNFSYYYKFYYAHRLMYEHVYGPIPPGYHVMHRCDNPACVRPMHLTIGTNADNIRDRVSKGRTRGRNQGLTPDQVRQIRARKASGEKVKDIASDYAKIVNPSAVYEAAIGRTWKSVQ